VTVAVQNDTNQPLSSVHVGVAHSGDVVFGFDGDGLCAEVEVNPKPEGCPFGPPGNFADPFDYFGPDTVLTPEPNSSEFGSSDAGTVAFNTALQPGQYTYFSLEAPPSGTTIVAGEVNDTISTVLNTSEGGLEFFPSPIVAFPAPVNVTDTATIKGPNAATATGKVKFKVYSDPLCTKPVGEGGEKNVENGETKEPSNPVGKTLPTNATYYWQATYSGDAKNTPAVSACGNETMTFGTPPPPPQPSVVTVLSGGGQVGANITVPVGTAVTDTAAVVAPGGQAITGRLSYAAYTTSNCAIGSQVASVTGGGLTTGSGPSSNTVTLATGTYYFQAFYSGNGTLNHAVSPCGSEVLTVVNPSPPPPPPPSSQFNSVGNPQVNTKNGQIVVIGQFPAPGTATASGVVTQGATLARVKLALAEAARKKRCKHGFVKKGRKCVNNAPVVYGTATLAIPAPGTYSIVISPTSRALKALKAGKKLDVLISTTFQNRAGGLPVTHVQSVFVKLKLRKHKHHKGH